MNDDKINPFRTIKVFSSGKAKNNGAGVNNSGLADTTGLTGNAGKVTAFPLKKLAYGGISSQFLGIVAQSGQSDNDNKPKTDNIFPF